MNNRVLQSELRDWRLSGHWGLGTMSEREAKDGKARLTEMKNLLEGQTAEVQNCQVAEAEGASQARNDRANLVELQDRIEHLDKR